MYKILEVLARDNEKNICSLEDPVELRIPGLTQVQVNPDYGLTFANGLRAILRQDPDVIFVGEIRDEETAEITVRAALTGHLVLSTLHTYDTVSSIARLVEMGVQPHYLAHALIGVINQRLFRLSCLLCSGNGCFRCFQTGYFGRQAVFEMLPISPQLREVIQEGKLKNLRMKANRLPFRSIGQQLLRHQAIGLTTPEECWSIIMADQHFKSSS